MARPRPMDNGKVKEKSSMAQVRLLSAVLFITIFTVGCASPTSTSSATKEAALTRKVTSEAWGKTKDGEPVSLYTLTNAKGAEARIATYGGIVVSLKVPDKTGAMGDIVNGFESLD